MDGGPDTQDHTLRGTDRARPARATRRARRAPTWQATLVVLAIALAVLALMGARPRPRPSEEVTERRAHVALDGGAGARRPPPVGLATA